MGKVHRPEGTKGKGTRETTRAMQESLERLINNYMNATGKEKEMLLKIIKRIKPEFKG
jgi:hypothetical protein